jgi:arginine transport system substrate-binding protein
MKKALTVLLLATLATGTASATTLHFGTTTANPPYETVNGKNQPTGFDIDLANALCRQMQVECKFTQGSIPSSRRCALRNSTP